MVLGADGVCKAATRVLLLLLLTGRCHLRMYVRSYVQLYELVRG